MVLETTRKRFEMAAAVKLALGEAVKPTDPPARLMTRRNAGFGRLIFPMAPSVDASVLV